MRDLEPADDRPLLGLLVPAQVDLPRHDERRHPGDQLAARHLLRRYRLKRGPMSLAVKISLVLFCYQVWKPRGHIEVPSQDTENIQLEWNIDALPWGGKKDCGRLI